MRVGFPWILSSESSLFNGLRGKSCGGFFLSLLSSRVSLKTASPRFGMAKRQIAHGVSLNIFLIFCKNLSFEPFRFADSIQRQSAVAPEVAIVSAGRALKPSRRGRQLALRNDIRCPSAPSPPAASPPCVSMKVRTAAARSDIGSGTLRLKLVNALAATRSPNEVRAHRIVPNHA
jgi:hypothetical protein